MQGLFFTSVKPYIFSPYFAFSDPVRRYSLQGISSYTNFSFLCSRNVSNKIIKTFRSLIFLFLEKLFNFKLEILRGIYPERNNKILHGVYSFALWSSYDLFYSTGRRDRSEGGYDPCPTLAQTAGRNAPGQAGRRGRI